MGRAAQTTLSLSWLIPGPVADVSNMGLVPTLSPTSSEQAGLSPSSVSLTHVTSVMSPISPDLPSVKIQFPQMGGPVCARNWVRHAGVLMRDQMRKMNTSTTQGGPRSRAWET